MFGDVIVPLDGSARSARALGPAVKAATALDSPLKVISFATELSRAVVESELEEQLEAARRESPGVECTLRVETSKFGLVLLFAFCNFVFWVFFWVFFLFAKDDNEHNEQTRIFV